MSQMLLATLKFRAVDLPSLKLWLMNVFLPRQAVVFCQ